MFLLVEYQCRRNACPSINAANAYAHDVLLEKIMELAYRILNVEIKR